MQDDLEEEWRDVVGYENCYQVSSFGRVRSLDRVLEYPNGHMYRKKGKLRSLGDDNGYPAVGLPNSRRYKIHRLVALAFIDNPENKKCINHMDRDKTNNHVDNLEWCTHQENITHAYETGVEAARGEAHGMSKLKECQVREIKRRLSEGETGVSLAGYFNVTTATISNIKNGNIWKYIVDNV